MKFWSLKSRFTIPQAFALTILVLWFTAIVAEGSFQAYDIYLRSIDYADFCMRLVRHWIMNLM